jgi:SAM-dependent methyltransferase
LFLWDRPADSWRKWGARDPYYAVLSTETRFRSAQMTSSDRASFYASGEESITAVLDHVAGVQPALGRGRALDFGCGAGRLVAPLARRFEAAVGVDISPDMRSLSLAHAAAQGLDNVSVVASVDDAAGSFDFIHSLMVFQHIPTPTGMDILSKLLGRLGPEGVAALQVPLADRAGVALRCVSVMRRFTPFNAITNVARGRAWDEPLMRMYCYDVNAISLMALSQGFNTLRLWSFDNPRFPYAYLIFAR